MNKSKSTTEDDMKKLLLLPLIAIGLALIPMKQADAQVSVGIAPVGVGFGYPVYGYSNYGYPGYGYYPRSYPTVVHLITERIITVVGAITTGTDTTSIIIAIITATKSTRYRKVNRWLGRDSKPAFLLGLFCCFNATLTEKIL